MKNLTLFKGTKGDHKSFGMYYGQHKDDKYKAYLNLQFTRTKISKTVNGKTVGDFKEGKTTTFGIELGSLEELGILMRFLEKDAGIFDKKDQDQQPFKSLLHKTGSTMEKALYFGQRKSGGNFIGIHDRISDLKIKITLSSSEMRIIKEYLKNILTLHWNTPIDVDVDVS